MAGRRALHRCLGGTAPGLVHNGGRVGSPSPEMLQGSLGTRSERRKRRDNLQVGEEAQLLGQQQQQGAPLAAPAARRASHPVDVLPGVVRGVVLDDPVHRCSAARPSRRHHAVLFTWDTAPPEPKRVTPRLLVPGSTPCASPVRSAQPLRRKAVEGGAAAQDMVRASDAPALGRDWWPPGGVGGGGGEGGAPGMSRPRAATSVQSSTPVSAWQNSKKVAVRFCCFCLPWMSFTVMST